MCDINPMFHMDTDYMWRWFVTDVYGNLVCISANAFFSFEDVRLDYDNARRAFMPLAA
ncbi:conserved hypothetical protein [Sphingomonas sp. EC-HK361]|nr:conserved hypothetical protein [Sphingomonas sp. EC-HK361]